MNGWLTERSRIGKDVLIDIDMYGSEGNEEAILGLSELGGSTMGPGIKIWAVVGSVLKACHGTWVPQPNGLRVLN